MRGVAHEEIARPTEMPGSFGFSALAACTLTFGPLLFYMSQIGRWSLDLDEFYTLRDSSAAISTILRYDKPIYYLLCHATLQTTLSPELAIRLPGAIAAGLIAPCYYWLGRRKTNPHEAAITGLLVAFHPWVFQHSQFGRFYGTMLLFSSVAILSLYRWLADRRHAWLILSGVTTLLGVLTHATAAAIVPAAAVGIFGYSWFEDRAKTQAILHRNRVRILLSSIAFFAVVTIAIRKPFVDWLSSQHGQYGNYSFTSLVLGFVAFCGLQLWALGFFPLIKSRSQWTGEDVFLAGMFLVMTVPFLFLAQFGGGVAPRYLMASAPLLFLLAGRHWAMIHSQLPSIRYQLAFSAAVLAAAVPTFASTLKDGNHCDYRSAAQYVDSLQLENAIVAASAHQLLGHYLSVGYDLRELRMLDDLTRAPRADSSGTSKILYELVSEAVSSERPLIIVSREDRRIRPPNVQAWFNKRFATLARFEKPRFDHRRNEMVVYELRPR